MGDASDAAAFLASIQRDLNGISDADRSTRRRAFDALTKRYVIPDRPRSFSFDFSSRSTRDAANATRGVHPVHERAESLTPHVVVSR
jgi:hypothetical protein